MAPVFGGFSMQLASWRVSFFVLAVIWGIFAIVASFMVESCPDTEKHQSYCKDRSVGAQVSGLWTIWGSRYKKYIEI